LVSIVDERLRRKRRFEETTEISVAMDHGLGHTLDRTTGDLRAGRVVEKDPSRGTGLGKCREGGANGLDIHARNVHVAESIRLANSSAVFDPARSRWLVLRSTCHTIRCLKPSRPMRLGRSVAAKSAAY
jgi:hypothetical protein